MLDEDPNSKVDGLLNLPGQHKRTSSRGSWTGFGFWNSAKSTSTANTPPIGKHDQRSFNNKPRSRSGSVFSQPGGKAIPTIFEPAATTPLVASHNSSAHAKSPYTDHLEQEDDSWRYGDGGSTPSFRAVVNATRILTTDPGSVVRRGRMAAGKKEDGTMLLIAGEEERVLRENEVALLAQRLVENAKRDGVGIREAAKGRRGSGKEESTTPGPGRNVKSPRQDLPDGGARKALLRTLSSLPPPPDVDSPTTPPQDRTRGARSSSIVSVLAEVSTGRRRSRTTTTLSSNASGPSMSSKSPSPGSRDTDSESAAPAVQMEAMMDPSARPPPMLVRRATADDFMPSNDANAHLPTKLPSRFGAEVAELEPYIDRYGFVYHLKYVQMLLDLQQGLSDVEEPEEVVPPRTIVQTVETTPGKVTVGRHRSATIATFNPSPSRPTISSADEMVTVPPPSGIDPSGSGSIRLRKAKLDQLAAKYRRPLVSLLGQLAEMHDKQEQERMKKWHQFLKYRRQKLPSITGPKDHEGQGWHDDVIGVANLGDGKVGRDLMKRFTALVHTTGIPIALRASVWAECSGAKDAFTPGEYQEILAVHQGDQHPTLIEIEKDVRRTFPTNVFFGGDGVGCEKLRRCLSAYAWRDPQIGKWLGPPTGVR